MWQNELWQEEDRDALAAFLRTCVDSKYKIFHAGLVPTMASERILGVRLPQLRRIAKEIAKGNAAAYLAAPRHDFYEETMLHGLVIAYGIKAVDTVKQELAAFIPFIDNWAVCDSVAGTLKCVGKNREAFYAFINEYLHKEDTYALRFAVVLLMDYYLDSVYIDDVLRAYDGISHEDYYVKMAVAWGISVAYVKEKEKTLAFLEHNHLDDFTYNKALQKIIESLRVPKTEKERMRSMKRK